MAKNIYSPFGMEAAEVSSLYEKFLTSAGVTTDTRTLTGGEMFFALKGENFDGNRYALQALEKGAAFAVVDRGTEAASSADPRIIPVDNTLLALKAMARCHRESRKVGGRRFPVIGLTGTNGKTSIATLLYQTFTALGNKCGLISTIANYVADRKIPTINTTPGPLELNYLLDQMVTEGCSYCFMEVSSHAVDQERIAGLKFEGGIFTNLTHDHLDYHKTFENYRNCKSRA